MLLSGLAGLAGRSGEERGVSHRGHAGPQAGPCEVVGDMRSGGASSMSSTRGGSGENPLGMTHPGWPLCGLQSGIVHSGSGSNRLAHLSSSLPLATEARVELVPDTPPPRPTISALSPIQMAQKLSGSQQTLQNVTFFQKPSLPRPEQLGVLSAPTPTLRLSSSH